MSTQQLALEPSKSGAVGKSFKQPKQNPEVLMNESNAIVPHWAEPAFASCTSRHSLGGKGNMLWRIVKRLVRIPG